MTFRIQRIGRAVTTLIWRSRLLAGTLAVTFLMGDVAQAQGKYLGMVALRSTDGKYLQAHSDGELHASNANVNEEETWHLYVIDEEQGHFTLKNWKNNKFLWIKNPMTPPSQLPPGPIGATISQLYRDKCPRANATSVFGDEAILVLRQGETFNRSLGRVTIRSKTQGRYLRANAEGDDTACGGEVAADNTDPPGDANWNGWWTIGPVPTPEPGASPFTIGRDIVGVFADFFVEVGKILSHFDGQ